LIHNSTVSTSAHLQPEGEGGLFHLDFDKRLM